MYTTKEVLRLLELSQSGLYYWLRVVKIKPRFNEKRERIFSAEDIEKI